MNDSVGIEHGRFASTTPINVESNMGASITPINVESSPRRVKVNYYPIVLGDS